MEEADGGEAGTGLTGMEKVRNRKEVDNVQRKRKWI